MSLRHIVYSDSCGYGYYDIDENRRYLEREFRLGRIVDCGDVEIVLTNIEQSNANITDSVKEILARGAMPVAIGGDHAVTYPVVRAYSDPIDVVHFDAHLDYRPFVHGVRFANFNPIRLVAELPNVGRIVQAGIRSVRIGIDESDLRDSRARGNEVVTVKQLRKRGIQSVFEHLQLSSRVYVSIDIDVLDIPLVPGCSSAEVGGLTYDELRDSLAFIAAEHEVVGFDLVEVNPLIDVPLQSTSLVAAQTMVEFIGRIVEQSGWKERHNVSG